VALPARAGAARRARAGLRARIEEALAGKPVRLARIETTTLRGALPDAAPALSLDELNALKPEAFFCGSTSSASAATRRPS
jgi:hypothetical protein